MAKRHDLAVEQADDRMQRPHPGRPPRGPSASTWARETWRRRPAPPRRRSPWRPARLLALDDVEVALLVVLDDGRVLDRLEARRLDEPGDGLLGRIDARALALLAQVGRLGRHALHHQRQPPRRRVGPGLARREPLRLQAVGHQPAQILRRPRLHPRRDFLGEQFEQQLSHGRDFPTVVTQTSPRRGGETSPSRGSRLR